MNKSLILVSSITYAMKARDILFRNGIKAYVERAQHREDAGCGYGVFVPSRTDEAQAILERAGIRVLGRAERVGAL